MKLLIMTQKVDAHDPILGFFHGWIEEFARQCEEVTVIGQSVGPYHLPENVHVYSLGKEKGASTGMQIVRFWKYLWSLRHQTDVALVHMTPIWVVLGKWLWVILRTPVYLWYEHSSATAKLRLAIFFSRAVFSATNRGMPFETEKSMIVGHAVDCALFHPDATRREEGLVVTLGRLTKVKHLSSILWSFGALPSSYRLLIGGLTITPEDELHVVELRSIIEELGIASRVRIESIPPQDVPAVLQSASLYVHAAAGGLDKAIVEAMASGCLILSASEASDGILPEECQTTREHLTADLLGIIESTPAEKEALRSKVRAIAESDFDLVALVRTLVRAMQ